MYPVYSVTHVPGLYPVLRSVGLLSVPYSTLAGASVARLVRPALSALRDENLCIIRAGGKKGDRLPFPLIQTDYRLTIFD